MLPLRYSRRKASIKVLEIKKIFSLTGIFLFVYLVISESPASVTVRVVVRKCLPQAVPRSKLEPL